MPLLLLAVFLGVPAVEIYVLVQVAQSIGALPTVALLVLDGVAGAALARSQGRKAWSALTQALAEHRVPAKEVADGALVVLGGALLLTPGFVTDVLGVLCLLPPTRAVLRRLVTGAVASRLLPGVSVGRRRSADARRRAPSRPGGVMEGEVIDGEVTNSQVTNGQVTNGQVTKGELIDVEAVREGRVVRGDGQADGKATDHRVRLDKPENR